MIRDWARLLAALASAVGADRHRAMKHSSIFVYEVLTVATGCTSCVPTLISPALTLSFNWILKDSTDRIHQSTDVQRLGVDSLPYSHTLVISLHEVFEYTS